MPGTPRRAVELVSTSVVSAGAVVLGPGGTVLLVHRPKYDDWSFPKGKLDRGEHATVAAVREVAEETGVWVRLGLPLGDQHYPVRGAMKTVHYWVGRAVGRHDIGTYQPNAEIDSVAWVPLDEARERLSYDYDVATLGEALEQRRKTRTLIVLRHSPARSRKAWRRDDRLRPLLATGRLQAARVAPVLAAYDARLLVTSSSLRCVQTLDPYAAASGHRVRRRDELSEEDSGQRVVRRLVTRLLEDLAERPASAGALVICTHRPVLPWVFEAAGVEDPDLVPGEMAVAHLRKGTVRGLERHRLR